MIPSKVMAKMATLGFSEEQAIAVASMLTEVEEATAAQAKASAEASKAKARARVQKWRDTHKSNVTERHVTLPDVTKRLTGEGAHVEYKTLTSEIEPQKEEQKETRGTRDVNAFKAALPELDDERLDALVKHRRSKRGQLTAHSAKLFRRDAEQCGLSLADAVDTCISRNWITVKPEFLAGRPRAGPTPSPAKPPQLADVFKLLKENGNGRQRDEDQRGAGAAVSYLPAVRSG